MFINPTNVIELFNICQSLKSGKTPGSDNIAMNVIKKSFEFITQPLTQIINLSLSSGIYPYLLKIAKVIPVFKTDNPEDFTNYRPISLLSNFSNIFEKVMHNRIIDFVNRLEILYPLQFWISKEPFHSLFTYIPDE